MDGKNLLVSYALNRLRCPYPKNSKWQSLLNNIEASFPVVNLSNLSDVLDTCFGDGIDTTHLLVIILKASSIDTVSIVNFLAANSNKLKLCPVLTSYLITVIDDDSTHITTLHNIFVAFPSLFPVSNLQGQILDRVARGLHSSKEILELVASDPSKYPLLVYAADIVMNEGADLIYSMMSLMASLLMTYDDLDLTLTALNFVNLNVLLPQSYPIFENSIHQQAYFFLKYLRSHFFVDKLFALGNDDTVPLATSTLSRCLTQLKTINFARSKLSVEVLTELVKEIVVIGKSRKIPSFNHSLIELISTFNGDVSVKNFIPIFEAAGNNCQKALSFPSIDPSARFRLISSENCPADYRSEFLKLVKLASFDESNNSAYSVAIFLLKTLRNVLCIAPVHGEGQCIERFCGSLSSYIYENVDKNFLGDISEDDIFLAILTYIIVHTTIFSPNTDVELDQTYIYTTLHEYPYWSSLSEQDSVKLYKIIHSGHLNAIYAPLFTHIPNMNSLTMSLVNSIKFYDRIDTTVVNDKLDVDFNEVSSKYLINLFAENKSNNEFLRQLTPLYINTASCMTTKYLEQFLAIIITKVSANIVPVNLSNIVDPQFMPFLELFLTYLNQYLIKDGSLKSYYYLIENWLCNDVAASELIPSSIPFISLSTKKVNGGLNQNFYDISGFKKVIKTLTRHEQLPEVVFNEIDGSTVNNDLIKLKLVCTRENYFIEHHKDQVFGVVKRIIKNLRSGKLFYSKSLQTFNNSTQTPELTTLATIFDKCLIVLAKIGTEESIELLTNILIHDSSEITFLQWKPFTEQIIVHVMNKSEFTSKIGDLPATIVKCLDDALTKLSDAQTRGSLLASRLAEFKKPVETVVEEQNNEENDQKEDKKEEIIEEPEQSAKSSSDEPTINVEAHEVTQDEPAAESSLEFTSSSQTQE